MRFKWIKSSKRSNQEKATPEMAPRYAGSPRRWHRNREASELAALRQRTLLYPISAPATWRHQRGFTTTATATSKATATATVAARNGNGNGNCRCAERQGQLQLSLRGQGQLQRTHGTLAWQEALDRQHVDRAGWVEHSGAQHPHRSNGPSFANVAASNVGLPSSAPTYGRRLRF